MASPDTTAHDTPTPNVLSRAMYFGSADQPCLGWWHAVQGPSSLAVVVCAPFGLEDLSAYRSLKYLATSLAAAGLPTLRFDYAGCGDSGGDDEEGDQVAAWIQSIHAAVELSKSLSGASQVALVGLRLGALLAAAAATERDDIQTLVAIAPPASGRAFVRDCRLLGAVAGVGAARADGGTQAGGFVLSAPTCESLVRLTLPQVGPPVIPTVLVIDRDDMPASSWARPLSLAGTRVVQEVQPGFSEMVDSPHFAVTPVVMMARVLQWLSEHATAAHAGGAVSTGARPPLLSEQVVLSVGGRQVREQAVSIGVAPRLIAQLSEPCDASRVDGKPERALLILNTGSERRIGPNRLWVSFARQRAAAGELVLRLDQAGVGESEARAGARENDVYSPDVLGDVGAALEWLHSHRQIAHCTVLGVCSGAYHGFQAALAGLPVNQVISINPLLFHWHPNISLRDTATHPGGQLEHMANASRGLRDPKKWLRVVKGQSDVIGLIRVLVARARRRLRSLWRAMARAIGRPLVDDLAADLQAITQRGVPIRFVFSRGDPGQIILREEAGSAGEHLRRVKAITVTLIDDADHTFTAAFARTRLRQVLHALLDGSEVPLATATASTTTQ